MSFLSLDTGIFVFHMLPCMYKWRNTEIFLWGLVCISKRGWPSFLSPLCVGEHWVLYKSSSSDMMVILTLVVPCFISLMSDSFFHIAAEHSLSSCCYCFWCSQWCSFQEVWFGRMVSCISDLQGAGVLLKLYRLSVKKIGNSIWAEKGRSFIFFLYYVWAKPWGNHKFLIADIEYISEIKLMGEHTINSRIFLIEE